MVCSPSMPQYNSERKEREKMKEGRECREESEGGGRKEVAAKKERGKEASQEARKKGERRRKPGHTRAIFNCKAA